MNMMSILEFIQYTKDNPLSFITYCEIIILPAGGVVICNPSHNETAITIVSEIEKTFRKDIMLSIPDTVSPLSYLVDKYNLVAVWYGGILFHKLNRFQKHSLKLLYEHNLISHSYEHMITNEYQNYLFRKEKGLEK